ncbi:hypothetical protein [Pseudobacteriovorax antillogorgiicola]|uniref:Uncharacterized protein n=1 Tax=Pseudobacteriovorax antillogorgiicola TaxID=1513793 RepID=A0A1Y6C5I3_9BACT|nr:hypothetical protein [Pseudobacteriovorax antillogorgiicola]TCS49913.1 hypothetical protein EDD56_114158 [Pseudobacteriovorax antillogorgiicola]SMF44905.1 hypothetical protein SAMN06296036_113163 [Pseudobacteriovorax antillogorgiicola]
MVGTQDSNIFIKGLIDFKKQGLWIRFFPKVKDKSITGINEKILVSGPIHEPSFGLYRDGKEVTDTSVWDWASSFFQGMFENVQDLISDPNLEPMKSGICEDYRQRIDAAKGKVLSH